MMMKKENLRGGGGSPDPNEAYREWEEQDLKRRDEWAAHGKPNAQGLYDIGWYAEGVGVPQTANVANYGGRGNRPIGHPKQFVGGYLATNGGVALPVQRGQLVPEAARGVGQPTIDGFLTGNAALRQQYNNDIKQAVIQEFIRQAVAQIAQKNK